MAWYTIVILAACFYDCGGIPKTSGIEQFWKDDYKVFEQIYGKTSDKDIYEAILPSTLKQDIFKTAATEKKERFQLGYDEDRYDFDDKYREFLKKAEIKSKPATSTYSFIKYDGFKPISESNDPEMYKYLQYLEGIDKEHDDLPTSNRFKPYMNYGRINPKDTEAYKSIQDILDAHERNNEQKGDHPFDTSDGKNKPKRPLRIRNGNFSNKCAPGGCKKKNNRIISAARPYVRRIKHRYISY